jgi:hypothetical protein
MMMVLLMQQLMVNTGGQNRKLVRMGGGGGRGLVLLKEKEKAFFFKLDFTLYCSRKTTLFDVPTVLRFTCRVDSSEWVRKAYKEFCSAFMIAEKYRKDFFYVLLFNY